MSIIGNMPGADLPVTFPSGETRVVQMFVLHCEVQDAECMAKFGHHRAQNAPTINKLRKKYELDYFFDAPVRTWKDCASVMRHIHTVFSDHIKASS